MRASREEESVQGRGRAERDTDRKKGKCVCVDLKCVCVRGLEKSSRGRAKRARDAAMCRKSARSRQKGTRHAERGRGLLGSGNQVLAQHARHLRVLACRPARTTSRVTHRTGSPRETATKPGAEPMPEGQRGRQGGRERRQR
eukprot:1688616-Rhodomonas_salina.1